MYFVKPLFFEFEPIKIANVSENGNVSIDLARFIALYEKQCLQELLGECLSKELINSFELISGATSYTLKANATEPIKRLVNGYTYEAPANEDINFDLPWFYNGCGCGCGGSSCTQRNWKGIVQTDSFLIGSTVTQIKRSFIADYIYYHYLLVNRSITAGTGQQVLDGENSQTVQNFSKRIDRWNAFVFAVWGQVGETSLYRFLKDNKSDYPTWKPNCNLIFKDKF